MLTLKSLLKAWRQKEAYGDTGPHRFGDVSPHTRMRSSARRASTEESRSRPARIWDDELQAYVHPPTDQEAAR